MVLVYISRAHETASAVPNFAVFSHRLGYSRLSADAAQYSAHAQIAVLDVRSGSVGPIYSLGDNTLQTDKPDGKSNGSRQIINSQLRTLLRAQCIGRIDRQYAAHGKQHRDHGSDDKQYRYSRVDCRIVGPDTEEETFCPFD